MSARITLRPATSADHLFLIDLNRQSLLPYAQAAFELDQATLDAHFSAELANTERQVVLLDGAPVGSLVLECHPDHYYVDYIALLPALQNQGLGSALLRDCLAQARRAGLPLRLSVLKVNPAYRLYLRLGFQVVEELPDRWIMSAS